MIVAAILSIIVIYAITQGLNHLLKTKICPICAAVFSTWVILFILWAFGIGNQVVVGILAGQSVTGILHVLEKRSREREFKHLWIIQLSTIILGTLTIFLLINKMWLETFLTTSFSFILLFSLFSQKRKSSVNEEVKKEVLEKLSNDLEHCCD